MILLALINRWAFKYLLRSAGTLKHYFVCLSFLQSISLLCLIYFHFCHVAADVSERLIHFFVITTIFLAALVDQSRAVFISLFDEEVITV